VYLVAMVNDAEPISCINLQAILGHQEAIPGNQGVDRKWKDLYRKWQTRNTTSMDA